LGQTHIPKHDTAQPTPHPILSHVFPHPANHLLHALRTPYNPLVRHRARVRPGRGTDIQPRFRGQGGGVEVLGPRDDAGVEAGRADFARGRVVELDPWVRGVSERAPFLDGEKGEGDGTHRRNCIVRALAMDPRRGRDIAGLRRGSKASRRWRTAL
jgi:hypothetical protein